MGACHIQYALLLSLLGFVPCSDTLTCNKGIMVKLGSNFSKAPIEWKTLGTTESAPNEICQETVLLVDVGEKSLILASKSHSNPGDIESKNTQVFSSGPGLVAASYAHFCDTELCNNAESTSVLIDSLSVKAPFKLGTTKCPVCLQFQGPCSQHITFVFCPVDTHCYVSDMTVEGGGLKATFSVDGCLVTSSKTLLKNQTSVGIFSIVEVSDINSTNSLSHVLVPGTLLAWTLGLLALLSPLCTGICPLG